MPSGLRDMAFLNSETIFVGSQPVCTYTSLTPSIWAASVAPLYSLASKGSPAAPPIQYIVRPLPISRPPPCAEVDVIVFVTVVVCGDAGAAVGLAKYTPNPVTIDAIITVIMNTDMETVFAAI